MQIRSDQASAFESQHTDSLKELEEPTGTIGKSPCFGANDAEEEVFLYEVLQQKPDDERVVNEDEELM